MSATGLPLPLPDAPLSDAEDAFRRSLAGALRGLHLAAGGAADEADRIERAAALAAEAVQDGESAVDLAAMSDAAESQSLLAALRASPVVSDGSARAPQAPLVLSGAQLYLARYWQYQRTLDTRLAALNRPVAAVSEARLTAELDRRFPHAGDGATDWQKVAAATAVLRHLCVISGGPGTGKTTTVVRILAILLTLEPALRIAIAAPTGKAAARVQDSIRQQLSALQLPETIAGRLPVESFTIHRLLGYREGRVSFRFDDAHRLPYDVVIVDEASMLDLALGAKLVAALRDDARLILLGDKDQLSSVEAGPIYAGISSARSYTPAWTARLAALTQQLLPQVQDSGTRGLRDAVVWLERSYRFAPASRLGQLARAINAADPAQAVAVLRAGDPSVLWASSFPTPRALAEKLIAGYQGYIESVRDGRPPLEVFAAFETYRVLCSTREGSYGSERLGALLVNELRQRLGATGSGKQWFVGRPVLVTANDYSTRLFNGDIGIVLPDEHDRPMVHVQAGEGRVRALSPSRLGAVQDALAITVHRAQGSEFDRVAVVIEPAVTRGLSRRLLYTAVTRARREIGLWATEDLLEALAK